MAKTLVDVPLTKSNSIPHPTNGIGGGAKVMRPAAPGTGVIAGGAVRTVLSWQVFVTSQATRFK